MTICWEVPKDDQQGRLVDFMEENMKTNAISSLKKRIRKLEKGKRSTKNSKKLEYAYDLLHEFQTATTAAD